MKPVLPVGVFLGLSLTLYLVSLTTVPGVVGGTLAQIVSAILVLPLLVWYRRRTRPGSLSPSSDNLRSVLFPILGLYLLVMVVRTPFVAFLQNPLEKAPLIYLLVLMVVAVEKKPLEFYGLTSKNLKKQVSLGLFLLSIYVLVPAMAITVAFLLVYNANLLAGYSLTAFALSIPFQVLAVGISEEGLFRGYYQTRLANVTSIRRAIIFQAGLFGLWHFVWHINPLDFAGMALHVGSTFVFGLLAGTYFRYIGSIAGLALFHGLSNSLADGLNVDPSQLPFSVDLLSIVFGAAILVASIFLIVLARRITKVFRFEIDQRARKVTLPL